MNLNDVQEKLKEAMLSKNEGLVSTLRMLISEIKNWQIDKQKELSDEEFVQLVRQQVKKRKESIEAFINAGRKELAEKEEKEAKILSDFLPEELSPEALEKSVAETIDQLKATSADFGKVMAAVMGKLKGQVDGTAVAQMVKKLLK